MVNALPNQQKADGAKAPMDELWENAETTDRGLSEPALVVDIDGFEGPLDLLLHLARTQKVDLARISVLALAEQYLSFVDSARRVRLELAADYLVMAAWLAFLKSKLLIPQKADSDEPTGEELAAQLAFPPEAAGGHARVGHKACQPQPDRA